jgi:hypothetical protein
MGATRSLETGSCLGMRGSRGDNGNTSTDNLAADDGRNSHPWVNQEMLPPSGSDRPSIRKAGGCANAGRTQRLAEAQQVAMDSASEGTREASSRLNKPTWVIGLPKTGRIGAWQSIHDQGSPP